MSSVQERTERLNGERPEWVETLQLGVGVAVEIPLAIETAPTGRDGQGKDLALGEERFRTGPSSWQLGVAEVVHDDVKTHTSV
jgi:hypothetical protein